MGKKNELDKITGLFKTPIKITGKCQTCKDTVKIYQLDIHLINIDSCCRNDKCKGTIIFDHPVNIIKGKE